MLTLEALSASRDLVAVLADKGVCLKPIAGTPVAELMKATKVWGNPIDCLSEIDKLPEALYQPNKVNIDINGDAEVDFHSAYLEKTSEELGLIMSNHVAYATTVVLPAVGECYEVIVKTQDQEANCGVASYKVKMESSSPLLNLTEIIDDLDSFANIEPVMKLEFGLDYVTQTAEQITNLLKIGSDGYDACIASFISQVGSVQLEEVWNTVFAGQVHTAKDYDMFRADPVLGNNRNWITYLIAKQLLVNSEKAPDVTGAGRLSASKYPVKLRQLLEVSGRALFIQVSQLKQLEKQGKLIVSFIGKEVTVNENVYNRFIDDGGDVETILGAVISGQLKCLVPELNARSEEFKNAWSFHITRAKMDYATSELINVRYAIGNWVRQYLMQTEDVVLVENCQLILNQLSAYLETIYKPQLKDIPVLALKVVTDVLFNHTDACSILSGVTEAMSSNDQISREDALNLSVTDYVANWIASQICIDGR